MSMLMSFKLCDHKCLALPWCLTQPTCVLGWFKNHLFGKVVDFSHNLFKKLKNECSIALRFEAHQETEVTPRWISVCIGLFKISSQNLLIARLYFLSVVMKLLLFCYD